MKQFAAFDIDGTLIRWQLYHTVVDTLAKQGNLGDGAYQKLHEARMNWKRRENIDSFRAYEEILIEVFESVLLTIDVRVFDKAVTETISEYKDQTYRYTRNLIKELKTKGYFLLAISGSHIELVEQIANYYGFDDFIGSYYERNEHGFSGKMTLPSKDKKTALAHFIEKHDLSVQGSYAIGDSLSDASMLKMVENPIAFNPDHSLYEVALQNRWPIVVERKNVTYRLDPTSDGYTLHHKA